MAATTGNVRGSTALTRGSRASTLLHSEESGTQVVGAFAVSPSRARLTCSESSCGEAAVIFVVVHGTPARSFTQVSKSSANSSSVEESSGAAAIRRVASPAQPFAEIASAGSRSTTIPIVATSPTRTTTAMTTQGHRRRRRASA